MKKGAIFDMDGLLFDTESVYQASWRELAAEEGVTLSPDFSFEICGTAGDRMRGILKKHFHTEEVDELIDRSMKKVHDKLAETVPEKAGAREILRFFKEAGVRTAVASSSLEEQIRFNLERTGLGVYIDEYVSGFSIQNGKPAPDIFILAAERLGLSAKDCYVFEDAYNGVRAGHASGALTVMIPDLLPPDEEMVRIADAICPSLSDALRKIQDGQLG